MVEATSGNTGVALAMVCAAKGYPCVITMAETFSVERRKLIRLFGARLVLTPKAGRGTEMVRLAKELADTRGWFYPSQFANAANDAYHSKTTGPEIVQAFSDAATPLHAFVTGQGTSGTLVGVGRVLRAALPATKIVLSEPLNAQIIRGVIAPGSGTEWTAHGLQGWNPDFPSDILQRAAQLEKARDGPKLVDDFEPVDDDESLAMARRLAAEEGVLTGISGGGTVAAALKVAAKMPENSNILAMIPDTAERYQSTALFQHIDATAQDEEFLDYFDPQKAQ